MITKFRPPVAAFIGVAAVAAVLAPSPANAFVVTLPNSTVWEISTISFPSPLTVEGALNTFSDLANQTFWGSQSEARTFSTAVYNQGGNSELGFTGGDGPYFAWESGSNPFSLTSEFTRTVNGEAVTATTNTSDTFTRYAVATQIPGPLPVLGAFAAFGWSRRMRQRINAAKPLSLDSQA